MKILVISDSHGIISPMMQSISSTEPDLILHLGDFYADTDIIAAQYPDVPIRAVVGNCDCSSRGLGEDEFEIMGKKFFITHGHMYNVKSGMNRIIAESKKRGADILLFGHSHVPVNEKIDGVAVINPGSVGGERSAAKTYAVLELDGVSAVCRLEIL